MKYSEILITGATGTTGQATIKKLLEKGVQVQTMVRKEDERSDAMKKQGIEIVFSIV